MFVFGESMLRGGCEYLGEMVTFFFFLFSFFFFFFFWRILGTEDRVDTRFFKNSISGITRLNKKIFVYSRFVFSWLYAMQQVTNRKERRKHVSFYTYSLEKQRK